MEEYKCHNVFVWEYNVKLMVQDIISNNVAMAPWFVRLWMDVDHVFWLRNTNENEF